MGRRTTAGAAATTVAMVVALGLGLSAVGCEKPPYDGPPGVLWEKGPYQAVYDEDGKLVRLLQDSNGDKVADAVILYENGQPVRGELDTDLDGAVDKWEYLEDGVLVRVEYDTDRDGKPDKVVSVAGGTAEEQHDPAP